jgi:hypothetical protein
MRRGPEHHLPPEVEALARQALVEVDRLLGDVSLAWDEIEARWPLSRAEARRWLAGELDDPRRAALYRVLFAYRPGLRAALAAAGEIAEPPAVIVFHRADAAGAGILLRAAAAPQPDAGEVLLESPEGYRLEAFLSSRVGCSELRWAGGEPAGAVTLYVDGVPLELLEAFDAEGDALVRSRDLEPVLRGAAVLEMTLENFNSEPDNQ